MPNPLKKIFRKRLELARGTRFTSFLFIAVSVIIAGAILWAANVYYNLDTGEVVMEHVQRVTQVIKAVGGLIVGPSEDLEGYQFKVVGQSLLATTTIGGATAELRFNGGTNYYVGLKANTELSENTVYILPTTTAPSTDYYLTVNPSTGQLSWGVPSGAGDIQAIGDVESGRAFTSDLGTGYGKTLWFHPDASHLAALTIDSSLTANATYTLPAVTEGNYYFTLASGVLGGNNRIIFASGDYTVGSSNNLSWDSGNTALVIGTSGSPGTKGQLRIYSGNANYLGFAPQDDLSQSVIYKWPIPQGNNTYVLTTDNSGNLSWTQVSGVGGITGTGSAGQVAFFDGTQSIVGSNNFTWATSTNTLAITGYLTVSETVTGKVFTGPAGTTTTIASASGQGILLDPASGKIYLGSGDYFVTQDGYEIGKGGTQILREMVPIFGFDLPVKTATTSYVKISRDIVNYPLNACLNGTSRVHKLVIRYGATVTSTWQVATSTSGGYTEFQLPSTASTSTGSVYTATTSIPVPSGDCQSWGQGTETDDWFVRMKLNESGEIMIYQIFLAGYDQVL